MEIYGLPVYTYPQWPLFLKVNPPKQGPNSNQNKGPHLGSRYIYIIIYIRIGIIESRFEGALPITPPRDLFVVKFSGAIGNQKQKKQKRSKNFFQISNKETERLRKWEFFFFLESSFTVYLTTFWRFNIWLMTLYSGDSWMYPYQRAPMGNPCTSPI